MRKLHAAAFGVLFLLPVPSRAAAADPGFPFVDVNHDGLFSAADGDIGISTGVDILALILNDGSFDARVAEDSYVPPAAPASLVVPKSVTFRRCGLLPSLILHADQDLSFFSRGTLSAPNASIDLSAGRHARADGASLSAPGPIDLMAGFFGESDPGDLTAVGASLTSSTGAVSLTANQRILGDGLLISALDDVDIENFGPSPMMLRGARLRSRAGSIAVEAAEFDGSSDDLLVDLSSAALSGPLEITVETHRHRIRAAGARVASQSGAMIVFDSAGGQLDLPGARIRGASTIDLWTWVEDDNARRLSEIDVSGGIVTTGRDPAGAIAFDNGGCGGSTGGPARTRAAGAVIQSSFDAELETVSKTGDSAADFRNATLSIRQAKGATRKGDLRVEMEDGGFSMRTGTIDATGARVSDPQPPTFYAASVIGDPTPKMPDLAFVGEGIGATTIAGGKVQVDWHIANWGPAATPGPVSVRFVFSRGDGSSDTFLGQEIVAESLAGYGGEWSGSNAYPLPTGLSTGTYSIRGVVDPDGMINELNEENNQRSRNLLVGPNLVAASVSAARTATRTYQIPNTVRNDGPIGSPLFQIFFYLSADGGLSTDDWFLGTRTVVGGLAAGAADTATSALAAGAGVPAGTYRVIMAVDKTPFSPGIVPETNERDNVLASPGTVTVP